MELLRTGAADSANHPKSADARTVAILKVVREDERFLVCSHPGPHGCRGGQRAGDRLLLGQTGKRVDLVSSDRIPVVSRSLPGADKIGKAERGRESGEFRAALEGRQELRAAVNLLA